MANAALAATAIFILVLWALWLLYARAGRFGFWQLAAELPQQFLEFVANDETWVVSDRLFDLLDTTDCVFHSAS